MADQLKTTLNRLYKTFDISYLESDPLWFPHEAKRKDREVVALLSASLAYGRVTQIKKSIQAVIERTDDNPLEFIVNTTASQKLKALKGIKHRFNDEKDIACLLHYMRQMIDQTAAASTKGSIGKFYKLGYDKADPTIEKSLVSFCQRVLDLDHGGIYSTTGGKTKKLPKKAGVRYFFPSPKDGSACKRLNLFLRWMVRSDPTLDKSIDFGLWKFIDPAQLVIPIDTHIGRISRNIGILTRNANDWKSALEVTSHLKKLDPADPVRYDFAICRLGILDECPKKKDAVKCENCLIKGVCIL